MTTSRSKLIEPDKTDSQGNENDAEIVGDGKPFIGELSQTPSYMH